MIQVLYQHHYCNHRHNSLELYNVQVQFVTSKTKLDIQYNKFRIRVVSLDLELSKRLKILSNLEKFYLTAIKYSSKKQVSMSLNAFYLKYRKKPHTSPKT